MSPINAVILRSRWRPICTMSRQLLCLGHGLHERFRPTLTSRTIAPAPEAIFFDMIELAMSGRDGTVPVTSRNAELAVRGRQVLRLTGHDQADPSAAA